MDFEELKTKLDEVITNIKESDASVDDRLRRLEEMASDKNLAVTVLKAWKEQLAKMDITVDFEITEETDVNSTIAKLSEIEIPKTEDLEKELEETKTAKAELEEKLVAKEKAELATKRLSDLAEAGINIPESQKERVTENLKNMTEEVFAEYKQDRLDFIEANKPQESTEEEEESDVIVKDAKASTSKKLVVEGKKVDNIEEIIHSIFE